jgi:CXXX repeat radical SAM target protein
MENKKNDDGLQSRRDFFKKAAKSALPILGAIVLAGAPQILKATEKNPMGCNYGCAGACNTQCYGCLYSCNRVCAESCNYNCRDGCKGGCKGTCSGSCTGMNY